MSRVNGHRPPRPVDVGAFVKGLASDAIAAQQEFDAAYERDLQLHAAFLRQVDPDVRALLGPQILPARTVITEHRVSAEVHLTQRRSSSTSVGLEVGILPVIPLLTRESADSTTHSDRIELTVRSAPPATLAFPSHETGDPDGR